MNRENRLLEYFHKVNFFVCKCNTESEYLYISSEENAFNVSEVCISIILKRITKPGDSIPNPCNRVC